ncbi:PP2C family protein-serine/threonine phosphatase [Catenuloplanes atrovinosus]|uniref:Serine/threonine protein phosphatase PrpC n=1 Tax=Catenuloplanes atrovinosus TaxID=137266 RepID=A0AAE4C9N1_9ACTN|nr:protein phosphatase 2C domain-containing protein [Catenuloplanes atrovinosus]MDR7275997.1 serine/threonine protein phosphatase PrpC [Catenuloplanes atrovinosus]
MTTTVQDQRPLPHPALRLTAAGATATGNRYPANFDVLHVGDRLLAVADGMGDGEGSAAAGRTAVAALVGSAGDAGAATAETLRDAVATVQREVRAAGRRLGGPLTGATLTALATTPTDLAWIVQLGDSRVYRRRGTLLELLTTDHTAAWLGAVHGWYPHDSPQAHAARYHLHRYAGHPDEPEADLLAVTLRPGDTYLLCTDGIADQVDYARLDTRLRDPGPLDGIARGLVEDSLARGGRDNATVALLRVG